ncbi:MAG: tetratricopeptide repeat protein [Microvirgula sp.]
MSRASLLFPLLLATALSACGTYAAPSRTAATNLSSPDADLRLARSALESGDTSMAATLFGKVLAATPDSAPARLGLADSLFLANELEQARQAYAALPPHGAEARAAALGLARIDLRQRQPDAAIPRYQALLAQRPDDAQALAGLGVAYDLKGDHAQAQATYRAGLAAHPADMALRNNLGLSLILSHQPRAGANMLLDLANVPSAPPQGRQNLALAYGMLGNADAAERILQIDLPDSQVQDNLRFYRAVRARLGQQGKGS